MGFCSVVGIIIWNCVVFCFPNYVVLCHCNHNINSPEFKMNSGLLVLLQNEGGLLFTKSIQCIPENGHSIELLTHEIVTLKSVYPIIDIYLN